MYIAQAITQRVYVTMLISHVYACGTCTTQINDLSPTRRHGEDNKIPYHHKRRSLTI